MANKNTKHSPGPWTAKPETLDGVHAWTIRAADGFIVLRVGTEADARLIAAAPDFCEFVKGYAAQECWDLPGEYPEAGETGKAPCPACEARTLIAKAEGR